MLSPRRSVALLFALALLTAGTGLAVSQYLTATGSDTTTGTVETVEMDSYTEIGRPTLGGNRYYQPNVTYTYRVDGQTYTGRDIAFGSDVDTNQRDRAARVLQNYAEGEPVTVYYDPTSPGDAYLVQRFDFFPAGVLVAFGLLLLGDALTPRTRWVRFVLSKIPLNQSERSPLEQSDAGDGVPDDPTRILDRDGTAPDESDSAAAPLDGRWAVVLWALCGLAALGTVATYLAVSRPPHDLIAYATVVVTVLGVGRFVYRCVA
ncbi:DUF3592 domain-containing protein [Haloarcula sp. CBA1130]|uniref:DUF3592 domain-containing protein n=1 Tax=unclassified Haloarcula TaxID=2624677 RepID=UPI0012486A30|nr:MULTISPECIES: DUF3592 domain-containing protein [unclassified Haloarcula]KAA9399786.1 DUF3592 domain-containing protein [Haloarcula sp. CBA1129]KAA9401481.1 DUF3592 domain-containing protein [Haloarcula sp. CBA1130]